MIWDDAVKQGREEGRSIGREEGREEGQAQASERYSRLILLLNRDNRTDQIIKIASDPEYREALYKEYKIWSRRIKIFREDRCQWIVL